jgi:sensor histidine kinase regulating citrate/malate metabolism
MDAVLLSILIIAIFGLILALFFRRKNKQFVTGPIPDNYRQLLEENRNLKHGSSIF